MGDEFEFVARHVISDTQFHTFVIDEYRRCEQQLLFVHADFKQFTLAALKEARREWAKFRSVMTAPLYAHRGDGSDKLWKHFVTAFGFKPAGFSLPFNNGEIRELFIST